MLAFIYDDTAKLNPANGDYTVSVVNNNGDHNEGDHRAEGSDQDNPAKDNDAYDDNYSDDDDDASEQDDIYDGAGGWRWQQRVPQQVR